MKSWPRPFRLSAAIALLLGATFLPWAPRLSSYSDQMTLLDRWSFDLPLTLRRNTAHSDFAIIEMDQKSYRALGQNPDRLWDRKLHARLLRQLTADGARLVVFDVFFSAAGEPGADDELAAAMRENRKVVLAQDLARIDRAGVIGWEPVPPAEPFKSACAGLGSVKLDKDSDGVLRRGFLETSAQPSLPWVAARVAGAAYLPEAARLEPRWLHYQGPPREALEHLSYADAFAVRSGYFRDKYVFVGGGPRIRKPGEQYDLFRTPYTIWDGEDVPGVDIVAVCFSNLLHGDAWNRLAPLTEFLLLLLSALLLIATWFWSWRPGRITLLMAAVVSSFLLAWLFLEQQQTWFSWLVIPFVQVPLGLWGSRWLISRELLKPEPVDSSTPNPRPSAEGAVAVTAETPFVADHTLLRRVGTGAYGDVWVARNAVGLLHAVKLIHRRAFESTEPFEREFRGITQFMPISRSHSGFVHVLQVGPEQRVDYFYYVMELADDVIHDGKPDVERYEPKNLATHLKRRKRLPNVECLSLGVQMTDALQRLHEAGLIHRDIKPSNIIFVNGRPKLADIGLVTRIADDEREVSFLGTRGYIPPEGPGTPLADIFSLGKVLYEAYTGLDREQFPSLPTSLLESPSPGFADLNQVVLKACEVNPKERYQSAAQFKASLEELREKLKG